MAYTYEAVIPSAGLDLFEEAFCRYMESLSFARMSIGGRLGAQTSHGFRRDDDLVSLSFIGTGQTFFRVVVDSESVPVVPVVLNALTEGVSDFLEPFWEAIPDGPSRESLRSLIRDLRDKFSRATPGQA
jgi:hypothetical protein